MYYLNVLFEIFPVVLVHVFHDVPDVAANERRRVLRRVERECFEVGGRTDAGCESFQFVRSIWIVGGKGNAG